MLGFGRFSRGQIREVHCTMIDLSGASILRTPLGPRTVNCPVYGGVLTLED